MAQENVFMVPDYWEALEVSEKDFWFSEQGGKEREEKRACGLQAKFWPLDGRLLQCMAEFQTLDL